MISYSDYLFVFLKIYFKLCGCVCNVCVYQRPQIPLELEFYAVRNCQMCVLGIRLGRLQELTLMKEDSYLLSVSRLGFSLG